MGQEGCHGGDFHAEYKREAVAMLEATALASVRSQRNWN
jgi:hypothetical protein